MTRQHPIHQPKDPSHVLIDVSGLPASFRDRPPPAAGVLDKAEAHAAARKVDPSVLLNSRLSPDLFALARQLQIAADQGKNVSGRLARSKHPAAKTMRRRSTRSRRVSQKRSPIRRRLTPSRSMGRPIVEIRFPLGPTDKGRPNLQHQRCITDSFALRADSRPHARQLTFFFSCEEFARLETTARTLRVQGLRLAVGVW
jgi:hypothetical protein